MREVEQQLWRGWQGWRLLVSRVVLCAALWWVLSEGAAASWIVGGPVVLLAGYVSAAMLPPLNWTAWGAVRFWAFFLLESWRGGVDVAWRAVHRRLPLDPGMVEHRNRLDVPAARASVANTVSLLPGTLSTDVDRETLQVHALDAGAEVRDSLVLAERRIADLFGLALERPEIDRGPN